MSAATHRQRGAGSASRDRVSDSDIQRLHGQNVPAGEIAARLMVPWQRVQAALEPGRVEAHQANASAVVVAAAERPDAAVSRIKLSITKRRAEVARLAGKDLDAGEIATQLNVSRATVWNDIRALGLPAGKRGAKADPDVADRRAAIVTDVNAGMRYPDVAAKHGCSISNIKLAVYRARQDGTTVKVTRSAGVDPARRDAIMSALLAGSSWAETVKSLEGVHAGITRDVVRGVVKAATPDERSEIDAAVAARVKKGRSAKTPRPVVVKAPAPRRVVHALKEPRPAAAKKTVATRKVRPVVAPVPKPPVAERAPRIAAPTERDERRKIADTAFGPETSDLGVVAAVMACATANVAGRWVILQRLGSGFASRSRNPPRSIAARTAHCRERLQRRQRSKPLTRPWCRVRALASHRLIG
jgi:DNA-directed RNA polymerase specialized sigma24 family protein